MAELTHISAEKMLEKGDYEYALPFYGSRRPLLADLVLKPDDDVLKSYKSTKWDGQTLIAESFVPQLGQSGLYVWGQAAPLRDSSGKTTGAIETLRDITEQRLTEKKLRSSELRFRTLFEEALNPIFIVDKGKRYIGANKAGLEFLECSLQDLLRKKVSDFYPAGVFDQYYNLDQGRDEKPDPASGGRTLETEYLIGGKTKTLLLNVIHLSGSRETVLFCIGQDITKRKRAELELLQSEKKFRGIVENTQDGIALIDELGHVVEWNIGQEKITGLERSSVLGQLIWDIQSKTDSSEDNSACDKEVRRRAILEILSTGRMPGSSGLVEQELTIEDGSRKIVQSQVFTIGTEKGFMMGLISRDVTEWKKAQEDLQRARGLLEIKVAERTSELGRANEILKAEIAERKRAEELITSSLNEKEVLLREIHHRVKNNLQVVSSLLYLQSRKIDDPQVSEVFKESQNRIKSMALIHEKLYRSGNLAKIDFSEYAKNLILYLFDSYGVSQSKISLKMEMEHVLLGVDTAVPCGLIINELISNSLKHAFAEAEHGEIEVSLRSNDAGRFLLKIRDNGVGLSDSLDLKNAGTLGLQLVNILVAQIDGHIEAKSEDGAEFEICFEELKYRDRA